LVTRASVTGDGLNVYPAGPCGSTGSLFGGGGGRATGSRCFARITIV
jgi:hypothetical protein